MFCLSAPLLTAATRPRLASAEIDKLSQPQGHTGYLGTEERYIRAWTVPRHVLVNTFASSENSEGYT